MFYEAYKNNYWILVLAPILSNFVSSLDVLVLLLEEYPPCDRQGDINGGIYEKSWEANF